MAAPSSLKRKRRLEVVDAEDDNDDDASEDIDDDDEEGEDNIFGQRIRLGKQSGGGDRVIHDDCDVDRYHRRTRAFYAWRRLERMSDEECYIEVHGEDGVMAGEEGEKEMKDFARSKRMRAYIRLKNVITNDGDDYIDYEGDALEEDVEDVEDADGVSESFVSYMKKEKQVKCEGGLVIPHHLWGELYPYQRTGVRWMCELHAVNSGGIVGDEMGLGKAMPYLYFLQ